MKARRVAPSLTLVLLAAAACVYAYCFDRRVPSDAGPPTGRRPVFPGLRSQDASYVELERYGERVVLERPLDAGAWNLASPVQEPADPAAVDGLLGEMSFASRLRDVNPSVAAGLGSPRVRGQVRCGPVEHHFALGAPAPTPVGAAYMQTDGEGTFVVDRGLAALLLRGADAYRNRALVPFGAAATARVEIRAGGGPVVLVRSGATFRVGGRVRASREIVERLFAGLADLRAESFPVLDGSLATPADGLAVVLEPRAASRPAVELRFGGPCPAEPGRVLVALGSPAHRWACVAEGAARGLEVPPEAWVDLAVLHAHADEIAEVRLEAQASGGVLDVARRDRGWRERAPEARDLDDGESAAVEALAATLAGLRATRIFDADQPIEPRVRLTIVRVDGETETVEAAAPAGGGTTRARRLDDGAILELPAGAVRALSPSTALEVAADR